MNENTVKLMNDAVRRNWDSLANVFCGKCGGARGRSPEFIAAMSWRQCSCTTPERSWARKSWITRANAWLHTEPHDLEIGEDKYRHEVTYHINGYENGLKIETRSLGVGLGMPTCPVPPKRKNFLHEMGR